MAKLTLIDLAKRSGNDATVGIVESMTKMNPFWAVAKVREIEGFMYKFQRRAGLPTAGFRAMNAGVTSDKSVIQDVVVECKIMTGISEVDKVQAEAYKGGVNLYRAMEDAGFLAAMTNTFVSKAYYGNSATTGAEIDGVGTYLSSLGGTCINATGTGTNDLTSMYFWSFSDTVGPQGRMPGVEIPVANGKAPHVTDMGLQKTFQTGSTTAILPVYTSLVEFNPGLAVYDSRSIGRLCNIKAGSLPTVALINEVITAMAPFQVDLITCSKVVYNYVQTLKGTTFTNSEPYASDNVFKRAKFFDNIPIMIDENITATEAQVS